MRSLPRRLLGGRTVNRYFAHFPGSRPQLPYLHSSSPRPRSLYARFLTTETKAWIKSEFRTAMRLNAYILTTGVLLVVAAFGFEQEKMERAFPSPHEYSWYSRNLYRSNRVRDSEDMREAEVVDWALSSQKYMELLGRLEDPEIDGAGLVHQGEEGSEILVAGVGRTGYDITAKPEPWRRGYYEALLGAARAAEFLDSCVRDKTRNLAFPKTVVIGPSNPNPRPMPPGTATAPREEDCEPAFVAPETFYMRILTTRGFSDAQRLDAALAYASWLEYKGTPEAAREMHKWGLDIATATIPEPESILDLQALTIKPTADAPSRNVLRATTAIAEYKARNKDLASALPMFLSILRARRTLPPPAPAQPVKDGNTGFLRQTLDLLLWAVVPPEFPPAPPDGNEAPIRDAEEKCAEAALMAWIGEIMYASASDNSGRENGLAWTRESVDVAEENLRGMGLEKGGRKVCRECLDTGLGNWSQMVGKLAKEEKKRKKEGGTIKKGWFGGSSEVVGEGVGRWEAEEELVRMRYKRARDMLDGEAKVDATRMYIFQ